MKQKERAIAVQSVAKSSGSNGLHCQVVALPQLQVIKQRVLLNLMIRARLVAAPERFLAIVVVRERVFVFPVRVRESLFVLPVRARKGLLVLAVPALARTVAHDVKVKD